MLDKEKIKYEIFSHLGDLVLKNTTKYCEFSLPMQYYFFSFIVHSENKACFVALQKGLRWISCQVMRQRVWKIPHYSE